MGTRTQSERALYELSQQLYSLGIPYSTYIDSVGKYSLASSIGLFRGRELSFANRVGQIDIQYDVYQNRHILRVRMYDRDEIAHFTDVGELAAFLTLFYAMNHGGDNDRD